MNQAYPDRKVVVRTFAGAKETYILSEPDLDTEAAMEFLKQAVPQARVVLMLVK